MNHKCKTLWLQTYLENEAEEEDLRWKYYFRSYFNI